MCEEISMSKKAKLITIITSATVAVALIVLAICLIVANNNREKTNYSIISCTAGSSAHLVLNANDKVMDIVPLTDEAKGITLNNSFEGLKYSDAIKLFVTKNVEAGYIDVNTDGYTVKITIGGCKKDYSKYQSAMKNDVNNYLSDMGIIAGAKVETKSSLESIVKELKETANTDKLSNKELIAKYVIIADLIKDILPSNYSNFFTGYDNYNTQYNTTIQECDDEIKSKQTLIDELNKEIKNLPEGEEKTAKQQQVDMYQSNIERMQIDRNNAYTKLNRQVSQLQDTLTASKDANNNSLTTAYKTNISTNSSILEAHKQTFESNKQATKNLIDAYRKSIEA